MKNYLSLLKNPIAFHRVYAEIGGGAGVGVFISQLMYWHGVMKDKHGKRWNGWFFKEAIEWEAETCTTRREREKAEKKLKELKILTTKKIGIPPRKHYCVNENRFNEVLEQFLNGNIVNTVISDNNQNEGQSAGEKASQSEIKPPCEAINITILPDMTINNGEYDNSYCQIDQYVMSDVAVQMGEYGSINCQMLHRNTEITTEITTETKTLCAIDESIGANQKGDNQDEFIPWVSAKGKKLNQGQQKVFSELWDAYGHKSDRAKAIDEFLKHITPMFGQNTVTNQKALTNLLQVIKSHVQQRSLETSPKTILAFCRWISTRRFEDELPAGQQLSQNVDPKNTEWGKLGFDSNQHKIGFDADYQQLKAYEKRPNPTSNDLAMIQTIKKKLNETRPQKIGDQ